MTLLRRGRLGRGTVRVVGIVRTNLKVRLITVGFTAGLR